MYVERFGLDAVLRPHVVEVFVALPEHVRTDLMGDPAFVLCDYEPAVTAAHIRVAAPGRRGPSRSVVLKRTLRRRSEAFVRWVIAHELAHAHLRNGGRFPGEDPEYAADELAKEWGFPRPVTFSWTP